MLIISKDFFIEYLDARFNETKADLKNYVDAKINALDKKIDAKFNELDKKIDAKFNELDKKFDAKFNALDKRITETQNLIRHDVDTLAAKIDAQNNTIVIGFSIFAVVITFLSIFIPGIIAFFKEKNEKRELTESKIIRLSQ